MNTNKIQDLLNKQQKLFEKFNLSLLIQKLWPEAFEYGRTTTCFSGNLRELKTMKLVIKNCKGDTKEFSILKVPKSLIHRQIDTQLKKAKSTVDIDIWKEFREKYDKKLNPYNKRSFIKYWE